MCSVHLPIVALHRGRNVPEELQIKYALRITIQPSMLLYYINRRTAPEYLSSYDQNRCKISSQNQL